MKQVIIKKQDPNVIEANEVDLDKTLVFVKQAGAIVGFVSVTEKANFYIQGSVTQLTIGFSRIGKSLEELIKNNPHYTFEIQ